MGQKELRTGVTNEHTVLLGTKIVNNFSVSIKIFSYQFTTNKFKIQINTVTTLYHQLVLRFLDGGINDCFALAVVTVYRQEFLISPQIFTL